MKKEKIHYLILGIIPIVFFAILLLCGNMFGSYTDWLNQHVALPHYFRELFYDTGELISNFAFNLGSGQNIFNFAYYSFLSPMIFLSYIIPFISMTHYIIGISLISACISPILLYKWFRNKDMSTNISFIISLIFLLSGPFLFHSHRHIMFVNYIPFLIMGLFGVDRYYSKGKVGLLIISSVLLVLTSFYYSIPSFMVIFLYMVYCYLQKNKKIKLKSFIIDNLKSLLPLFVGILICSFYLFPTAYAVINGRGDSSSVSFFKYLIPSFDMGTLTHGAYSLGLSAVSFVSLIYALRKGSKKEDKFISIVILVLLFIPIFMYILNGGLYVRAKVFIPLIPLVCLLIGRFLVDLFKNKIDYKYLIYFVLISLVTLSNGFQILFYVDFICLIISLLLYLKWNKKAMVIIPLFTVMLVVFVINNVSETYVEYSSYDSLTGNDKKEEFVSILSSDSETYRFNNLINSSNNLNYIYDTRYYQTSIYSSTFNTLYADFYYDIFHNSNPYRNKFIMANSKNMLFETFMGVKYVASNIDMGLGYEKVSENIYRNLNSYPLIYRSSNLLGKDDFNNLSYPENIVSLLNNVVVDKDVSNNYKPKVEEIRLDYTIRENSFGLEKLEDGFTIESKGVNKVTLDINEDLSGKVLFLEFDNIKPMSCDNGDLEITVNGIKNLLTCREWLYFNDNRTFYYVISDNNLRQLEIVFGSGVFDVESTKMYAASYEELFVNDIDEFVFDSLETKGDYIRGNIDVTRDGYLVTSIPYDKGFKILVNGKKRDYEIVNEAFIGFPISSGNYDISITYESPLLKEGIVVSGFVLMGLFIWAISKKRG